MIKWILELYNYDEDIDLYKILGRFDKKHLQVIEGYKTHYIKNQTLYIKDIMDNTVTISLKPESYGEVGS